MVLRRLTLRGKYQLRALTPAPEPKSSISPASRARRRGAVASRGARKVSLKKIEEQKHNATNTESPKEFDVLGEASL
jgi:hypothetical protein